MVSLPARTLGAPSPRLWTRAAPGRAPRHDDAREQESRELRRASRCPSGCAGRAAGLARSAPVGGHPHRRGVGGGRCACAGGRRRHRHRLGGRPRHGRGRHGHRRRPRRPARAVRRDRRARPLLRRRRPTCPPTSGSSAASERASCCRARPSARSATTGWCSCPSRSTPSWCRRRWRRARWSTSTCCPRAVDAARPAVTRCCSGVTVVSASSLDEGFGASGQRQLVLGVADDAGRRLLRGLRRRRLADRHRGPPGLRGTRMVVVLILASGAAWESAALGCSSANPGSSCSAAASTCPTCSPPRRPARPTWPWSLWRRPASTWRRSTTCVASRCVRWHRAGRTGRPVIGCAPPGLGIGATLADDRLDEPAGGSAGGRRRLRRPHRRAGPARTPTRRPPATAAASWRCGDRPGRPGGRPSRWPSRPSSPPAAGVRRWSTPIPTAAPWPSSWASSTRSPDCSRRRGWRASGLLEARFGSVQRAMGEHLTVVTGLPRPDRWVEVRAGAVEHLLEVAAAHGDVVVDTGFSLESDPVGEFGARPPRNQTTLAALGQADEVLVVGSADPVGLARLARGLVDLPRGGRRRPGARGGQPDARLPRLVREGRRRHGRGLRPAGRPALPARRPADRRPGAGRLAARWPRSGSRRSAARSPSSTASAETAVAPARRSGYRRRPAHGGRRVRPRRAGRARRS